MNMYEELTSKSLQTRVTQARDTVKSSRVGSLLTTRNVTNSLLFILVASCSVMSYYQMIKYVSGKTTVAKSVDTSQKELVCCRNLFRIQMKSIAQFSKRISQQSASAQDSNGIGCLSLCGPTNGSTGTTTPLETFQIPSQPQGKYKWMKII